MKPHIIMHMGSSLDGRIIPDSWPADIAAIFNDVYEQVHRRLAGDAWIVGRITMAEFAKGEPVAMQSDQRFPRQTWKAPGLTEGPYAVAIDRSGALHLNTDAANGDPIVVILTEGVADAHLAELQRDGISYLFAGIDELDLAAALETLARDFGIKRLLLEGGGGINGSFLSLGLIDEISLLIAPVADGTDGPRLFSKGAPTGTRLELDGIEQMEGGFAHLRYRVVH